MLEGISITTKRAGLHIRIPEQNYVTKLNLGYRLNQLGVRNTWSHILIPEQN